MKLRRSLKGFTLIELLVVISIIAILAGIAVPTFTTVIVKGNQTKDLSNAKQIFLALKTFAIDHDGGFPYAKHQDLGGAAAPADAEDSNAALANLIPNYVPSEKIFYLAKSKWCNLTPPDEQVTGDLALAGGENNFAYVPKLNDSSNPNFPILADGFATGSPGVYATDETQPGGIWKGRAAIVVRVDGSGKVELVNSVDHTVHGPIGGAADSDIFAVGATNWLGATNKPLNPLAATKN